MYECTICQSVNHASRHHCQTCGAIPKQYSILGEPARLIERDGRSQFISVAAAYGVSRQQASKAQRINLRTVALDYYGE